MNKLSEPLDGVQKNTFKCIVCPITVNFQSTKAKHCTFIYNKDFQYPMHLLRWLYLVVCVQTRELLWAPTKLNPILASISHRLINDFDIKTKPKQQIDVGNIG